MKKHIIIIIILLSILLDAQRVSAAERPQNSGYYANIGIIYEIDKNNDLVYFTDGVNNWSFYGVEDWQLNDVVLVVMHDNNTQNTIKDDVIVSIRYSNITF